MYTSKELTKFNKIQKVYFLNHLSHNNALYVQPQILLH